MKKVYLLSWSIFAAGILSAQNAPNLENLPLLPTLNDGLYSGSHSNVNQNRAGGDVFYTNTFDDEADWTVLSPGGQGAWEYGGPTPTTLAPSYMTDIASTTKADGYYYFNGVQYLVAGNVLVQNATIENVVAIDCSGRDGVILELEQSYRAFNDDVTSIDISIDGTSWTEYIVNDNVPGNSGTDENITINLTSIAANQATVFVKFRWQGNAGGYGWIIDDLTLTESHDNNIVQQDIYLADIFTGYEYTKIPKVQGGLLTVQSALVNNGVNTPTGVQAHVIVTDASNAEVFNGVGGTLSGALAVADEDTLTYTTTLDLSTLAVGVYEVTNIIEYDLTDDDQTDDTLRTMLEITENNYSHYDDNAASQFVENPGRNNSDSYDGFSFGSVFEINSTQSIQGIDFYITTRTLNAANYVYPTTTDNEIQVEIWEEGTDFQAPTYKASYSFDMADMNLSAWNTLNFNRPVESSSDEGAFEMQAGTAYRVVVVVEGGYVLWGVSTLDDDDFSSVQYSNTQGSWFSLQAELGIELNFDQTLNIESDNSISNLSVAQNVPNPFTGNTVISYSLNEASNVSLQVVDLAGKVVTTINEGNQNAGEHSLTIDGSTLAEGTYFYTFTAGEYRVTKKMVVSK